MNAKMDDFLAVGLLVAFIDVPDLKPIIAAIKTLVDADATLEIVAECVVENWRGMKKAVTVGESGAAVSVVFKFWS